MTGGRRTNGKPCALCGIRAGAGIPIFSYTLLRSVYTRQARSRTRTRSFGTVSVCDRCIQENARGAAMTRDEPVAV